MEKTIISDFPPSTQAFVVKTSSNTDADREVASTSENDQSLTQAFTIPPSVPTPLESIPVRDLITPTFNTKIPEPEPIPSADVTINKSHSNMNFQLAPPRIPSRLGTSIKSDK